MNQPQDLYNEVRAGGNIKSYLLNLHRRNTGELPVISNVDTEKVASVSRTVAMPVVRASVSSTLPHRLYIDQERRQYLALSHLTADTIDLVTEAVKRFCGCTGHYPDEIVPCPSRYILLKYGYFCPVGGVLIPFSRDFIFPIDYDVVVRSRYVI
jgi:hypothetical protein